MIWRPEVVFGLSCAHLGARALHVVAELGTAEAIGAEPRTAEDLARDSGVDPDALDRLLRLLETNGLVRLRPGGPLGPHRGFAVAVTQAGQVVRCRQSGPS